MAFYIAIFGIAAIAASIAVLMHWPKLDADSSRRTPADHRRK